MLQVGIIGAGHFGAEHARALRNVSNARLVAACRNDREALAAFTTEFGGKAFVDWRDLLADPNVDAVVISLPHHLHAEVAIAAAEAGKHIMIEKPLAPTVSDCLRILQAAEKAGVTLMPGHTMRFTMPFIAAKRFIDEGDVGAMRFGYGRMIKFWMEENRRQWHLSPETGGGMLFTAGIHALDRLLAFAGRPATHVSAITTTSFHQQTADDAALLLIDFGGKAAGQLTSIGYANGAFISGDELVCDNGVIVVDFFTGVKVGQGHKWRSLDHSIEENGGAWALIRQWQEFTNAISDGRAPSVTGQDGLHVVACIEAVFQASNDQTKVAISHG